MKTINTKMKAANDHRSIDRAKKVLKFLQKNTDHEIINSILDIGSVNKASNFIFQKINPVVGTNTMGDLDTLHGYQYLNR